MEFNALQQLHASNAFPSQTLSRQNSQQQQFFQIQPTNAAGQQMMLSQAVSYASHPATTQTQHTSVVNTPTIQNNQYTNWGQGGLLNMATVRRPRPQPLMSTSSVSSYNMAPPHQPSTLQAPSNETAQWGQKSPIAMDLTGFEADITERSTTLKAVNEESNIIGLRRITHTSNPSEIDSRRPSQVSDSTYATTRLTTPDMGHPELEWAGTEQQTTNQVMGFSPMNSPCGPLRPGSRSRGSPVPHNNMRTSPYTLESNRRLRWSTGMNVPVQAPQPPRIPYQYNRFSSFYGPSPLNPHNGLTSVSSDHGVTTFAGPGQSLAYSQRLLAGAQGMMYGGAFPDPPRQLASQNMFPMLPSDRMHPFGHFADMSDPPDLFASLNETPVDPPEEDMKATDPDLIPHEQELRFTGDLYTPRWVRGHGNKREGWCGICKPGRWLVLKNSAYWYDKSFTHGVCAQTGAAFSAPEHTRRVEGNADAWEGLCGQCGEWLSLVSSKKKGPTTWFRHVSKCHVNHKPKDIPKRRRNTAKRHTLPDAIITDRDITDVTDEPEDNREHSIVMEDSNHVDQSPSQADPGPDHSMFNSDFGSISSKKIPGSAAVSPKTIVTERMIEQSLDGALDQSGGATPLTAVRMKLDGETSSFANHALFSTDDTTCLEQPTNEPQFQQNPHFSQDAHVSHETQFQHHLHYDQSQNQATSLPQTQAEEISATSADVTMSKPAYQNFKTEVHDMMTFKLEDQSLAQEMNFKAPPSPAITPVTTPQLSSSSLSTPQMDTPHQSMPLMGLGVQGLHIMSGIPEHSTTEFPFSFNELGELQFGDVSQQYEQYYSAPADALNIVSGTTPTAQVSQTTYAETDYTSQMNSNTVNAQDDLMGLPLELRIQYDADLAKYSSMDTQGMSSLTHNSLSHTNILEQYGGLI